MDKALHRPWSGPRPAVFLDRDGTLIVEREHLADPTGVELLFGTTGALHRLQVAGYALVLVTNQSGIARGLFGVSEFEAVQRRLARLLARDGVELDGVYHCPHHPDVTGPCSCRKPALGLFQQAAGELRLDLARSIFVGDRARDVLPARAFGATGILVRTGYGAAETQALPSGIAVVEDVVAAVAHVLQRAEQD